MVNSKKIDTCALVGAVSNRTGLECLINSKIYHKCLSVLVRSESVCFESYTVPHGRDNDFHHDFVLQ